MQDSARWPYSRLSGASRLPALRVSGQSRVSAELLVLVTGGALAAAAVAFIPLNLRLPGHAILKAALPMVLGMALAPRQFAGTISGVAAAITAGLLIVTGIAHTQAGGSTALLALGPAIDLATSGAKTGGRALYWRFALAGLMANFCAFTVRWASAWLELDGGTSHMKQQGLWPVATYAACGLAAGLISAAICFRASPAAAKDAP